MRMAAVATTICLFALGLASAADVEAAIRKPTNIPAQELASALQALAQDRDFQVVYRADLVGEFRTAGAVGELTRDEALTRLLAGTGLTYRYLDEQTVTIVPAATEKPATRADRYETPASRPIWLAANTDVALPSAGGTAASQSVALEEIVVTAQKRSERLQDVPAAVSALTGDYLAQSGAASFQDYLNAVPGVSFYQNGGQNNAIFIRGVSSGVNIVSTSTTGVYVDEAPVTQSIGATVDPNPFDLERVEVLRGPQGTLYGASSMGGTIRLIMNKPQFDAVAGAVDGKLSSTSHGGTNYEGNVMVNLPASDALAFRLVGGYRDLDGYIDDANLNRANANFDKLTTFRGMARWKPTDSADVLLTVAYQKEEYGYHPEVFVGPAYGPYQAAHGYPERGEQPFKLYGLTVNYDLGFGTLTSATNYFDKRSVAVRDQTRFAPLLGVSPGPGQGVASDFIYDAAVVTQEMRLASKEGQHFHWLAGGFYSGGKGPDLSAGSETNIPALAGVNVYTADIPTRQHQFAAFGELGYDVTDKLTVSAGLRHSHYVSHNLDNESGVLAGGDVNTDASTSNHFLDQRYSASYKLSRDHLLYAQVSSGSRQGGPTGAVGLPQPCIDQLQSLGFNPIPSQTNPDSLWNYELGSKNTFSGGQFMVNAAAYYTKWKDMQSLLFLDCGTSFTSNTGSAQIRGVELEMSARPIEPLTLTLSGAYTNTSITQGNADVGALEGDPLPLVPEVNGSFSARYDFPLFSGLKAYVRSDVTYVDSEYADFRAARGGFRIPAYSMVNARVGLLKDRCEFSLYATNLFDERIVTFIARSPLRDTLARPLTVGLNVKTSF